MSVKVQAWVWDNSDTSGNDRIVLLAIADEANDDGSDAYPSQDRLAFKCRINRATVMRSIRRLEADGEILVERPDKYGRGRYNVYVVLMGRDLQKVANSQVYEPAPKPMKEQRRTARKGAKGRGQMQPDPKTLRPIETEAESTTPVAVNGDDVDTVLDAYRLATGRTGVARTPGRERLIKTWRKLYPLDDLIDAVRGWRYSPHNCGQNDRGTVYNDIELLLRDAKHIEQFRDYERGINRPASPRTGSGAMSKSRINSEAVYEQIRQARNGQMEIAQ